MTALKDYISDIEIKILAVQECLAAYSKIYTEAEISDLREYLIENSGDQRCEIMNQVIKWKAELDGLFASRRVASKIMDNHVKSRKLSFQSAVATGEQRDGIITTDLPTENVTDVGGADEAKAISGMSDNSQQGQKGKLTIEHFLERPVEIYRYSINMDSDFKLKIPVWDLWSKQASVRAKLRNYAYLRGDLHCRIAISGTPFHLGRVLVNYQPYGVYNKALTTLETALGAEAGFRDMWLNYNSQSPGSFNMNVMENTPLEVICPFISAKPMHRLFNGATTAIADTTSFDDFAVAGDLYLTTYCPVETVNDTTEPLSMFIYCWMENVDLGVSTATQMVITTEAASGRPKGVKRETMTGPIETVASRIVAVSSALTNVAFLGPYATATSVAFGALQKVAAIFGWSRPANSLNPNYVKPVGYMNSAATIGMETVWKDTIDPEQELTVDPRSCGSTTDDMIIKEIASRKSYYSQFPWNTGDTQLTPIFTTNVNPQMVSYYVDGSTQIFSQPTALAFATAPFAYWRGDIVYKFDIVCSAFHRGKLGVLFEPNIAQYALITSSVDMNKNYMQIVDIQETQTFEVRVSWASYRAWLQTPPASAGYLATNNPTFTNYRNGFSNGFISVFPFTKLQAPGEVPVTVLVSVYSDDLHVNQLEGNGFPTSRVIFIPAPGLAESKEIDLQSAQSVETYSDVALFDLNESTATTDTISQEHFGEEPVSFRGLLKRYVTTDTVTAVSIGAVGYHSYTTSNNIYPRHLFARTSYQVPNLFDYLQYAYLGVRGGYRHRVRFASDITPINSTSVKFTLNDPYTSLITTPTVTVASVITSNPNSTIGTVMYPPAVNSGFEVEFPLYTNNLWLCSFAEDFNLNTATNGFEPNFSRTYKFVSELNGVQTSYFLEDNSASAEDFSFMRFQGAPWYTGPIIA